MRGEPRLHFLRVSGLTVQRDQDRQQQGRWQRTGLQQLVLKLSRVLSPAGGPSQDTTVRLPLSQTLHPGGLCRSQ